MCLSQNRGGHHGRLVIPAKLAERGQERLPVKKSKLHEDRPATTREKSSRVISHDYHDHKQDSSPEDYHDDAKYAIFPIKLHSILEHAVEKGHLDIISWNSHGRSFRVHQQSTFMEKVLPKYFTLHKFTSFQRQLNLYGFQRITRGPDKGGYYHELFLRGKPFLAHQMQRTRVKGTKVRPKTDPSKEPDFYAMPPVDDDSRIFTTNNKQADTSSEEEDDDEEEEEEETSRSPSPSVVDTSTASQKLGTAFSNGTATSTVIPYKSESSHVSDAYKSDVDDSVILFEGRPFYYVDPYEAIRERPSVAPLVPSHPHKHEYTCSKAERRAQRQDDSLFSISEMDAMMARLDEPGGIWSINVNDMSDQRFGVLLENLVIHGSGRCSFSV